MATVSLWLLLVVNDAGYNRGNASVLAKFAQKNECIAVREQIKRMSSSVEAECFHSTVIP